MQSIVILLPSESSTQVRSIAASSRFGRREYIYGFFVRIGFSKKVHLTLVGGVLEEFLDKVDVGHDHTAAAVALETKLVHRITN